MDQFEKLLAAHRSSIESFVRYRLIFREDAEDILQEVYLTAYQRFGQLKNPDSFKAWMLTIARNKCNDYFKEKARQLELPLEAFGENRVADNSAEGRRFCDGSDKAYLLWDKPFDICRFGASSGEIVRDTMTMLREKDQQILYLYFWKQMPQADIAKQLNIPLGTVKSRLHTAKQNFKNRYPYQPQSWKGEYRMKRLPEYLPEYKMEASNKPPFSVKWEELQGWFLVPKLGEKLSWGLYEMPSRKCSDISEMCVTGKAVVHGIEGVEVTTKESVLSDKKDEFGCTFVVQLTDTHCRYLAAFINDNGIRKYTTFLDGEEFLQSWGFGEDNCGKETDLCPKGEIKREGNEITFVKKEYLLDIVGRYTVTIGGRSYDTVCVMDLSNYGYGVISEQFLDKDGRTILWRRFNRNDWAINRYGKPWTELLPENHTIIVNGETYVHWYDCVTDYIM